MSYNRRWMKGFEKASLYNSSSVVEFIEQLRKTQSFNHLSDEVIRGWILGRIEMEQFGDKHKSSSHYVEVKCYKCRGKGWFGRGRPDCPACVAQGKEPVGLERRWTGGRKFTGQDKRRFIWTQHELALIDRESGGMKWYSKYDMALRYSTSHYPAWVDDLEIKGRHEKKDKAKWLEGIKNCYTFSRGEPKVPGRILMYSDAPSRKIDWSENVIRLALTFGCTCPITGEYVARDEVSSIEDSGFLYGGDELREYVAPLGFHEFGSTSWWQPSGRQTWYIHVLPFSRSGIKAIQRAVNECRKAMGGEVNAEWVLAEIMQSRVFKHAA